MVRGGVAGTRGGGGYAERAVLQPEWTFPLPPHASYEEGASFLLATLTAYLPLVRALRIGPETSVLVHAASGGVGSAALQLCRFAGARVYGTATLGDGATTPFVADLDDPARGTGPDRFGLELGTGMSVPSTTLSSGKITIKP